MTDDSPNNRRSLRVGPLFSEGYAPRLKHAQHDLVEGTMAGEQLSEQNRNGHEWSEPNGRRLVAAGESVLQHHCIRCSREFLIFEASGSQFAVYPSAVSFYQLNDEVTQRWLTERCPGVHLTRNDDDLKQCVAEWPVSESSVLLNGRCRKGSPS
jgi:hypothetical protein